MSNGALPTPPPRPTDSDSGGTASAVDTAGAAAATARRPVLVDSSIPLHHLPNSTGSSDAVVMIPISDPEPEPAPSTSSSSSTNVPSSVRRAANRAYRKNTQELQYRHAAPQGSTTRTTAPTTPPTTADDHDVEALYYNNKKRDRYQNDDDDDYDDASGGEDDAARRSRRPRRTQARTVAPPPPAPAPTTNRAGSDDRWGFLAVLNTFSFLLLLAFAGVISYASIGQAAGYFASFDELLVLAAHFAILAPDRPSWIGLLGAPSADTYALVILAIRYNTGPDPQWEMITKIALVAALYLLEGTRLVCGYLLPELTRWRSGRGGLPSEP